MSQPQRTQSIASTMTRTQSVSDPPVMDFVTVAVLPPRLPENVAPRTGIGAADAFNWDERLNWVHNEKVNKPEATDSKKWMRKAGLTTQRKKATDKPPFIFRQIPYDTWRKHYAKNKEGRYRGTLAPAEDCLLLPEDVEIWRFGEAETKADLWTRGKAPLPVYDEAHQDELPQYSAEYAAPPPEEPRIDSVSSTSGFTADGKTASQIIAEAEARNAAQKNRKKSWKDSIKRGAEFAMMGANT